MKQQGSLIKKLRTDRKISQARLAEGISSRTTLSSFENRKTNLSSQTLFDYLDKMNITVHEFSLLLDSEATDQKRQLVQDFYTRYYDRTLTLDYLTSLEERYFETQNFFIILCISKACYCSIENHFLRISKRIRKKLN